MKQLAKILLVCGFTTAVGITTSFSAGGPLFTFDEFGTGPTPSTISVDPASGIATLTYILPFAGSPGDVLLFEPSAAGTNNQFSDLLRFDGHGHMFFFSETETTEPPNPADVAAIPPPISPLTFTEVGPEGSNGIIYTPPAGGPGFDPSGPTYHIISDVPEPASAALLLTGLWVFFGITRFRRNGSYSCSK